MELDKSFSEKNRVVASDKSSEKSRSIMNDFGLNKVIDFSSTVCEDLFQKDFMSIKFGFFTLLGAGVAFLPYLVIHMKALGLNVQEMAIIFSILPIVTLFVPPAAGLLADKIGNFKVLLSFLIFLMGCSGLLYLPVPRARPAAESEDARSSVFAPCEGGNLTIDAAAMGRLGSGCRLALPGGGVRLNVTRALPGYACSEGASPRPGRAEALPSFSLDGGSSFYESRNASGPPGSIELLPREEVAAAVPRGDLWTLSFLETSEDAWCEEEESEPGGSLEDCPWGVLVFLPLEEPCPPDGGAAAYLPAASFWSYLVVRVLQGSLLAASFMLFEGAAIAIVGRRGGDYGLQRLWSALGTMISAPLLGYLLDLWQASEGRRDSYSLLFYGYFAIHLMTALCVLQLDLQFKSPTREVLLEMRMLLRDYRTLGFLVIMFASGIYWGYIEGFLFWYLDQLGAKRTLMGLTITIGTLSGLPFLVTSGAITRCVGHPNILTVALVVFGIRLLGYSLIVNPWHALYFEALESITSSLMLTVAVTYASELATPSTITTMQGMSAGVHYGLGRSVGSLIGGMLMKSIGVRKTFQVLSILAFCTAVLYAAYHHLFIKRKYPDETGTKKNLEKDGTGEATQEGDLHSLAVAN